MRVHAAVSVGYRGVCESGAGRGPRNVGRFAGARGCTGKASSCIARALADTWKGRKALTPESAETLRLRLRGLGLSDGAISAAWPKWWSEDAEGSPSARAELRFGVARRLGLDPRSLLHDGEEPRFLWREEARFKHLSGESELERAGITSFGRAIAAILLAASSSPEQELVGVTAPELRDSVLAAGQPYVAVSDLLALSWALAVPVVHLRVFPWPQKRMAAMTVNVGGRSAVLLGKDASYPAPVAFYLAHELGHIALGHVAADRQIVDLEDETPASDAEDQEERDADAYALELLTGDPAPIVLPIGPGWAHGRALAKAALDAAEELRIEPGTLALCFGHSTGDWQTANAALVHVYSEARPVWGYVNTIASKQLESADLSLEAREFLDAVLGTTDE